MNKPEIMETIDKIVCVQNHKEPVICMLANSSLNLNQRLLCQTCLNMTFFPQAINFEQAKLNIQKQQETLYAVLKNSIASTLQQINELKQRIHELKYQINQTIDQILLTSEKWIQNLLQIDINKKKYCLKKELELLNEPFEIKQEIYFNEFNKCNQQHCIKIKEICQVHQFLKIFDNCQEMIEDIQTQSFFFFGKYPNSDNHQDLYINFLNQSIIQTYINCQKDNSPIIYIDLSSECYGSERLKCQYCFNGNSIPIDLFLSEWKFVFKQNRQKFQLDFSQRTQILKKFKGKISQQRNDFFMKLQKIFEDLDFNQSQFSEERLQVDLDENHSIQQMLLTMIQQVLNQNKIKFINNSDQQDLNNEAITQINSLIEVLRLDIFSQINTLNLQNNKISWNLENNKTLQTTRCCAIAFNKNDRIVATSCYQSIKLWNFDKGELKDTKIKLSGHKKEINCILFSKINNWLVSCGDDFWILLWKEDENGWKCSSPGKHDKAVQQIILNKSEDQLISCSKDCSIRVWRVDSLKFGLFQEQTLNYHQHWVLSIAMNISENYLVSTSADKQLILWTKDNANHWNFKSFILKTIDDFGLRICFFTDTTILWQQCSQGYIHVFQMERDNFIEIPYLKIVLNANCQDKGTNLFPSIVQNFRKILIQKHSDQIYLISQYDSGFKVVAEPIQCESSTAYGQLSNNGEHLIIWNDKAMQFKIYQIKYY